MSDNEENEGPNSYIVEVEKYVEVDSTPEAAEFLKGRQDVDSIETALAQTIAGEERMGIEPEEKLLRLEVEVNETSDD